MRFLAAGVPLLLSCGAVPGRDFPPAEILGWRLIEVEVRGGHELILEPDDRAPSAGGVRIEMRLSRRCAGAGERVEAEVWLPGSVGRRWLEIRPTHPGVRLLGPGAFLVEGEERVTARFTSDASGRGGIWVAVR